MMSTIELDPIITNSLKSIFEKHNEIEKVVLFGSRAKGTAKPNSDIDLAIYGICDPLMIENIFFELDALPLPYKFDVKSFEGIQNCELRQHIERVGIVVYS